MIDNYPYQKKHPFMDIIQKMLSYADLLYKIAYTKTTDHHEVEDLVQETYF